MYGEAIVDPVALELEVLWDETGNKAFRAPDRTSAQFIDDIAYQYEDKTLNLEIVVFEPGK